MPVAARNQRLGRVAKRAAALTGPVHSTITTVTKMASPLPLTSTQQPDDDDGDAGDNIRPSTRKTTTAQSNSNFIPVTVSPRTPGALARTPSAKRGGGGAKNGANTTDVNATHSNLNRRVRGFAGLLRDSLGRAGRVSSERDMKSECLKLVDRLRRFVAEGDAEDDGFAG